MTPHGLLAAAELAPRLARREVSAESVVRACLERIDAREREIRAWAFVDPPAAIAQARALDRGPVAGPLHGLPIGVKDLIDTFDMPTAYGSPIYAGHRPAWDAAAVALARRAGAVILGKTVTTELATPTATPTRNPCNPAHTPGVSSSGSAAAVADGMVPLALGTQTGGSVIRPAAYCGAVAFKPTHDAIARGGIKAAADSLDTVGVFGRSVADVALLASVLAGRPGWVGAAPLASPPRIGVFHPVDWGPVHASMSAALEDAAGALRRSGAAVADFALPGEFAGLLEVFRAVAAFELARNFCDEFRRHPQSLSEAVRATCADGFAVEPERYDAALVAARRCRERFADAMAGFDVLLVPGADGEAPELPSNGSSSLNVVWTMLHAPAVVFPGGRGGAGLPLGLQVVGRRGEDARTLAAADWIARVVADGGTSRQ